MSDPVKILAMYLTDSSRVVSTSIGLQVGGKMGAEAKAFYALRDAFDVRGYATQPEAETAIRGALAVVHLPQVADDVGQPSARDSASQGGDK